MDANEFVDSAALAADFRKRALAVVGTDTELLDASDAEIVHRLSAAQYAINLLISEAKDRGLIKQNNGVWGIPYVLPDGVEPVETVLTRKV